MRSLQFGLAIFVTGGVLGLVNECLSIEVKPSGGEPCLFGMERRAAEDIFGFVCIGLAV